MSAAAADMSEASPSPSPPPAPPGFGALLLHVALFVLSGPSLILLQKYVLGGAPARRGEAHRAPCQPPQTSETYPVVTVVRPWIHSPHPGSISPRCPS